MIMGLLRTLRIFKRDSAYGGTLQTIKHLSCNLIVHLIFVFALIRAFLISVKEALCQLGYMKSLLGTSLND